MSRKFGGNLWVRIALCCWLLIVVVGMIFLIDYAVKPGHTIPPPERWPSESRLHPDTSKRNLIVFLHPKCPCSHATLAQLSNVKSAPDRHELTVQFVVYCPENEPATWAETSLVEKAKKLSETTPFIDFGGFEIGKFGAQTSGHTMLFDQSGRLLFSGGVTVRRNHEGTNKASDALATAIRGTNDLVASYPVFGCPLTASL